METGALIVRKIPVDSGTSNDRFQNPIIAGVHQVIAIASIQIVFPITTL